MLLGVKYKCLWGFALSAKGLYADFLTAYSLAQSNCSDWKKCAETCGINYRKTCKTRKQLSWFVTNTQYYWNISADSQILCTIMWLHDYSF